MIWIYVHLWRIIPAMAAATIVGGRPTCRYKTISTAHTVKFGGDGFKDPASNSQNVIVNQSEP